MELPKKKPPNQNKYHKTLKEALEMGVKPKQI
jgi:hypothetical protein